jgi:hypothetical protein
MFYVSNFNPSLFIVSNHKYNVSKFLSYPKKKYYMLNATVYDYTESFYCVHLYIIVQCILLLEQPDDKAQVKGAHSYEFIVRSPIMIPIQHFRQWTIPHHSAQTVTAGLVIHIASSYIFLLVGRSMTIKNMGTGSLNITHSNLHMTSVNLPMMNV